MVRFVPVFVGVAWLAGLKQVTASSSLPLWRADNHPCATTTTKDRIAAFSPSSTPHQDLPSGVRNAATEFGADPTGQTDSTRALQTAIDAAQTQNFTIFLPVGCYVVTDMLNATEPRNGRWQPVVIDGERTNSSRGSSSNYSAALAGMKATFVLPKSTASFGGPHVARTLLSFQTDWCLAPGGKLGVRADGCVAGQHQKMPPYNFNQVCVLVVGKLPHCR